ncbi:MAG: redoxin domain-containing protein [Paludibacteraceae bacterium]|nr:redoxin domain-containing protein [Paludibacteraceae bacterium]
MKKYLMIAAAVLILTGCQKKSTVDLRAEWESLYGRTEVAYEAAETSDEAEAVLTNLTDSAFILLSENMDAAYADTLFSGIYYMLSAEQKQSLFALMPKEMLEGEMIAPLHQMFLKESATSAGNPYTDISGLTPEGEELALSEIVGKSDYVLVDFWASWCGPCRRLIPVLKEIYAGQPQGRLQILSCSVDREEDDWRQALSEEQMGWPQIREDGTQYNGSDLYGVISIPTTILIDKEGTIIARNPDEAELEKLLWGE